MRRILFVLQLVILVALPASFAQINAGSEPELAGFYTCDGVSVDGKPYGGVVEIRVAGPLVHARWMLASGDAQYGVGLVRDGKLSMGIYGESSAGVVVYKVKKGNPLTLVGEWASPNAPGVYAETLVKAPAGHPPASVKPKVRGDPKKLQQG